MKLINILLGQTDMEEGKHIGKCDLNREFK